MNMSQCERKRLRPLGRGGRGRRKEEGGRSRNQGKEGPGRDSQREAQGKIEGGGEREEDQCV